MLQLFLNEKFDDLTKADTASTASSAEWQDKEVQIQIDGQDTLSQLCNELEQGTAYQHTKTIQLSFGLTNPYQKISKLRRLEDAFKALGSLPQLEELIFSNADLVVSSVYKLLKKSSLKTLKFHNCTLIAKTPEHATDKLWKGIQLQTDLRVLEILHCSYTASETLCRDRSPFSYPLPRFVSELTNLHRLVLDECILYGEDDAKFLLTHTCLRELEIKPAFRQVATANRRQQYQLKKQAIRTLLTETVPQALAQNTTLRTLLISLDDYHLEQVYVDVMSCWIDLVQHDNSTLTELRATHLPLHQPSDEPDWYAVNSDIFEYAESYLHHNLKSILRLNQLFGAKRQQQLELVEEPIRVEEEEPQQEQEKEEDISTDIDTVTEIWV